MNLLLLLSALLAALTGATVEPRVPQPEQTIIRTAVGVATAATQRRVDLHRPALALPGLAAVADQAVEIVARPRPAIAPFMDRRRE